MLLIYGNGMPDLRRLAKKHLNISEIERDYIKKCLNSDCFC